MIIININVTFDEKEFRELPFKIAHEIITTTKKPYGAKLIGREGGNEWDDETTSGFLLSIIKRALKINEVTADEVERILTERTEDNESEITEFPHECEEMKAWHYDKHGPFYDNNKMYIDERGELVTKNIFREDRVDYPRCPFCGKVVSPRKEVDQG